MTSSSPSPVAVKRPDPVALVLLVIGSVCLPSGLGGQDVKIRDLTVANQEVPVRLVGYGLVVGLDGSGDRVIGGFSSGHTVRSIANLLRRFDVEVPDQLLRTRNVAAVLVTAEVSPYLRPGGRFQIHVSSVGDAVSLRGGVLWMTPLVPNPGAPPVATAQGALLVSQGMDGLARDYYTVETTARIPDGGILEQPLPAPDFARTSVLYLREPNLATATRIALAINETVGDGTARAVDPGAVALDLGGGAEADLPLTLAEIGELRVSPQRVARVIIDSRTGTVVAGGDVRVGEAVVSHGSMTLSVGGRDDAEGDGGNQAPGSQGADPAAGDPAQATPGGQPQGNQGNQGTGTAQAGTQAQQAGAQGQGADGSAGTGIGGASPGADGPQDTSVPGDVRMEVGVSVQDVAAALHAVAAPPAAIGAIFESLREVGAIRARVVIR